MSAYIVSDWTMQRAVAVLVESGFPASDASRLGRRLWALNAAAIERRYPSDHEWSGTREARRLVLSWCWNPDTDTRIYSYADAQGWEGDAWAALTELHYQCAEGDVTDMPLFKLIGQAIEANKKTPKRAPEYAPVQTKPGPCVVREFSSCGPCLPLGEVVRITPKGVTYRDYHGKIQRRHGRAWQAGRLHVEPCQSCMDHPQTQYPNGHTN